MTIRRPDGFPGFQAKVTPPEARPYSADTLYSICTNYAPFALGCVEKLVQSQRMYDESEGKDREAAKQVSEMNHAIWQAIEYGTNRSGAIGRTSTETDVWFGRPVSQPVNPDAAEIGLHGHLPED